MPISLKSIVKMVPIVIDLDFRMNGNMERTYTDETIMTFSRHCK